MYNYTTEIVAVFLAILLFIAFGFGIANKSKSVLSSAVIEQCKTVGYWQFDQTRITCSVELPKKCAI
jgi:hypothetical protein